MMQWREAVLSSLKAYCHRRSTRIIERQAFIADQMEDITRITESKGATPAQTLSRVLQDLRDEGVLEFLAPGQYLLLDTVINVEDEELPDDAIDHALRANLLQIGIVPTDNPQALVRQRKGRARIHQLTIENYGSCCAVCDVADPVLLVASHIIGWAEAPKHRGNLSNIICLCRIHDALFEAGYWSLDDNLSLVKKESVVSKTIQLLLDAMISFRLPMKYPPVAGFVRHHRERIGFAGP
jgi:hypothetical protein